MTARFPQGSIIGLLLFILYINDMSACCRGLQFIHFADDTTALAEGDDLQQLCSSINRELEGVDRWLRCNRLSLNINKTSYMIISNRDKSGADIISMRGCAITQADSTKFLAVYVDNRFSFDSHLSNVCGKVSRAVGVLGK